LVQHDRIPDSYALKFLPQTILFALAQRHKPDNQLYLQLEILAGRRFLKFQMVAPAQRQKSPRKL
jgi:hypothetical protein